MLSDSNRAVKRPAGSCNAYLRPGTGCPLCRAVTCARASPTRMTKHALPRCSVPDCHRAAGAIIDDALLCGEHAVIELERVLEERRRRSQAGNPSTTKPTISLTTSPQSRPCVFATALELYRQALWLARCCRAGLPAFLQFREFAC